MASNSFGTQDQLTVDDETYIIHRLARIDGATRLPYSLKVLLENLLRNEDGRLVTAEQVSALAGLGSGRRARPGGGVHPGAGVDARLHRGAVRGRSGRDA